jgi:hypothetical protein
MNKYRPQHKWLDWRSVKFQLDPLSFALSAVENVASDAGDAAASAGGGGGLANLIPEVASMGSQLLTGNPSQTMLQGGVSGGPGGSIAPQVQHYGPFGLLTKTIPGLVSAPPSPTYANSLQFGPIPAMAQTSPTPLTPMAMPMPLAGPSGSGMMVGGSMMPSIGSGPMPQVSTPGMAPSPPVPVQASYAPQMGGQPSMPFMSPYTPQPAGPQAQAAAPYPAAAPAAPQMSPWQATAMNQLQQAGISPASMSQALMPTIMAAQQGQAAAPALSMFPNPPPFIPMAGSAGAGQPGVPVQGANVAPSEGGLPNVIGAAAGYPAMLAQGLQGAMDNVNSFNNALKEGSKQVEGAAEVVKQSILGPAEKEVKDELATPQFTATDKDGKEQTMTLPEYRKHLRASIQAGNEEINKLQTAYENVGKTPEIGTEIETEQKEKDRRHEEAEGFMQGQPKKAQGGLMKWAERGFELSDIAAEKGVIANKIAMQEHQQGQLQQQAAYLDSRVDAIRNRYQKASELAYKAAQDMRDNYYKIAETMLGGVKGINELQAQTIRGSIADMQHQGQIEQMQNQNALTAAKIQEEATKNAQNIEFQTANAGRQAYQAAQHDKTLLVTEMMKKLQPNLPPDKLAKALQQFMSEIDISKVEPPGITTAEAKK